MANPERDRDLDPMLDLLGKMEGQVNRMEGSRRDEARNDPRHAPPPDAMQDTLGAFQSRLASELHEIRALREEMRAAERQSIDQLAQFTELLDGLKAQLPDMVEENISARFLEIEERFHSDLKDAHDRSIDAFLHGLSARVGQRVSDLESGMAMQIDAMAQLHEYHVKTGRNVQRLLHSLDRLTGELMRLASLAGAPMPRRMTSMPSPSMGPDQFEPRPTYQEPAPQARRPRNMPEATPAPPDDDERPPVRVRPREQRAPASFRALVVLGVLGPLVLIAWYVYHNGTGGISFGARRSPGVDLSSTPLTGVAAQLKTAGDFAAEKNFTEAENIYRTILKNDAQNRDAIKGMADVLFKQQRYEEAAAVLKNLGPDK